LVCIVWGLTYEWLAIGVTWVPLLFTALRYTLAGLLVLVLALSDASQRSAAFRTGSLLRLAIAGCLMFVMGNGVLVWALQSSDAVQPNPGIVAVTIAMIPVYTSMLTSLQRDSGRVQPSTWGGLVVGLAGVALLSQLGSSPTSAVRNTPQVPLFPPKSTAIAMIALQFGCISWAAGSVYASRVNRIVTPAVVAGTQMLTAGCVLLLLAIFHGDVSRAPVPSRQVVAALLAVTLVGSVVGYYCYALALRHLSVNTVSLHAYINPIVAMAVTAWVEGRGPGLTDIAATVLVLTGVALALHSDRLETRQPDSAGRAVKT